MSDHVHGPDDEARADDVTPADDAMSREHAPQDDVDAEPQFDVAGAALGALSLDEETAVLAAAMNDPAIAAELAALSDTAAQLARLAQTHAINRGRSAGMRSRILARAAGTRIGRTPRVASPTEAERTAAQGDRRDPLRVTPRTPQRPVRPVTPPSTHPPVARTTGTQRAVPYEQPAWRGSARPMRWVAIAAAIGVIAAGVYAVRHLSVTPGAATDAVASRDSVRADSVTQLRAQLASRDSTIAALTGMHTQVIDLVSNTSLQPMARIFWNQQTQQWTMYATHMQRPAAGKIYQVWLIARGHPQPISAGTFMPDPAGSAVMTTKYDLAPGSLRRIAITEEPDGGMPAPTGQVMFAGVGR